jgi:apolipoprotein N-acyltransferase
LRFWQAFARGRFPIAILSGIVWALAFPKPGLAGLAWIAPALLCLSAGGRRGWAAWRSGFVGGLTFYLISLHWLLFIPLTGAPILGWIALSGYMAIYPATWTWLCSTVLPVAIESRAPTRQDACGKEASGWHSLAQSFQATSWSRRLTWALSCAAAWVALEFLSSNLLTGFPWNLLGVSQYRLTPLIQLAANTGVWGISFLIVWFSQSLLSASFVTLKQPGSRSAWLPEIISPTTVVATVFAIGFQQLTRSPPELRTLKAVLIQPAIPQTVIWDSRENQTRFEALLRITQQALTNKPDLLIWPESAVPKMLRYDPPTAQAASDVARTNRVWLILNSDDAEPHDGQTEPDYFNAAFLINRDGELAAKYHKQRLVMFGEYVPFVRWLPFLKWLAPVDDYVAGRSPGRFDLPDLGLKTSVLICFEDMFPQLTRQAIEDSTDLLVNLTNDGWFGEGSEQWQQAAGAVFRAVENRRPLIRCTNNGLTCWVDEFGRIRQHLDNTDRTIYGEGFLFAAVELPDQSARIASRYHRYGDWFAWTCLLLTLGRLFWLRRPRKAEPSFAG